MGGEVTVYSGWLGAGLAGGMSGIALKLRPGMSIPGICIPLIGGMPPPIPPIRLDMSDDIIELLLLLEKEEELELENDDEDMDDMIEVCQPCRSAESGIGASIAGIDGEAWGRVVGEDLDCWRLSSGRRAMKHTEGLRWKWCKEEILVDSVAPEKSDLMFVKGLGSRTRVGYSVVNSEYIAFHPHQCLPKYEIEYEI